MVSTSQYPRIYDGDGDDLMAKERDIDERLILIPDALPSKAPDRSPRIRIQWGQLLLEDLLAGRYRSLVCAVNPIDNSHGIIAQLATLLPTSQWSLSSITAYARQLATPDERVKVLKYDMDAVEVLAILRPIQGNRLTVATLSAAFKIIAEMIQRKPGRQPSASVSFLGAAANALVDANDQEPSFETVLRTMYEAGYTGDVYPSPAMWQQTRIGVYARYPFPAALNRMREGGY